MDQTSNFPPTPPPEPGWQAPPPGPRPLRRSRDNRMVAGICGGFGHYLGVDPVLLRVAFVALTLAGGSGILLYLIGWIVIPEEHAEEYAAPARREPANAARLIAGTVLILVGVSLLVHLAVPWIGRVLWPLVLVIIGAMIVLRAVRR